MEAIATSTEATTTSTARTATSILMAAAASLKKEGPKCSRNCMRHVSWNEKKNEYYKQCSGCLTKKAAYKKKPKGKASITRYKNGESGKAKNKRYRDGEAGKATNKRYKKGEAGQATADRFAAKRTKRRQKSEAMRLDNNIMCAADHLIRGEHETSPTFVARTAFTSSKEFLDVVKASCVLKGLDFDKRETWELDHKIPREAFDFEDLEDVKRCWSAANIHVMTPADNKEKSWKLIDEWIAEAGPACYPAAWDGKPPTEEMKKAHHEKMMAEKPVADDDDDEVDDEFDEFEDEDDEFEGEKPVSDDDEFESGAAEFEEEEGAGSSM